MSTSSILEELLLEDYPPRVSSPARLFEALAQYRLSPSRSLPNELLSSIFLLASHDHADHHDAATTPVRISHVCSHWRQVALLTAPMWTALTLAFPVSRAQLSRAITWLSRSQRHALDILLDLRDPAWDWAEPEGAHAFRWQDTEAVLRLLLPHVRRWRRVALLADTWAPVFTFLWYTRGVEAAPVLESLVLARCNAYFAAKGERFRPAGLRDHIPLFGGIELGALREVTLTGVHVDWAASKLRGLTALNFKYQASDVMPTLDEFTGILAACPNLEQLSVVGWGPQFPVVSDGEGGPDAARAVQLPHLRRLLLGFVDTDYAIKLVSLFHLPSLEELSLDDVTGGLDPSEHVDATPLLEWMLDNAHSTGAGNAELPEAFPLGCIRTLHLHSIHADEGTLTQLFRALHELRFLALHSTPTHVLRALSPPEPQPPTPPPAPCPLLEHLECHYHDHTDPGALADVVAARTRAGAESVRLLKTATLYMREHEIAPARRAGLVSAGVAIVSPVEI